MNDVERELARLEALVAAAEQHRSRVGERLAHADRLTIQIRRVEQALVRVAARLDALPTAEGGGDAGDPDLLDERRVLREQERNLRAKVGTFRGARARLAWRSRPGTVGAHAHLHALLLVALDGLRCDPTADPAQIMRVRRRLVELVRARRERIDALAAELATAGQAARDFLAVVQGARGPEASARVREGQALEALEVIEGHVGRAEGGRAMLVAEWPSLGPLLEDPGWTDLPFEDLRVLLVAEGLAASQASGLLDNGIVAPGRVMAGLLERLAHRVRHLPPPGLTRAQAASRGG